MARKLPLHRRIRALIDELEPSVQDAFLKSVADLRDNVILKQVVEALEARDIDAAIRALNIERSAFTPLKRAIEQAYSAGGEATVAGMPKLRTPAGAQVVVRFDVSDPRAEAKIAKQAGELITGILDDTRTVARTTILEGFSKGAHPNKIGLDLAGRVSRVTGKRQGGVLGMTSPQAEDAKNLRLALTSKDGVGVVGFDADGKPIKKFWVGRDGKLKSTYSMRNKRYDRDIIRSIKEGKPLSADLVGKMHDHYVGRAIKLRGEMIARTETGNAVMAAKQEAFKQGLDKTGYTEEAVTRKWRSSGRENMRHTHASMNGQTVKGLSAPYVSPSGARLMHPLDGSLGAGASEIINCVCDEEINIDFFEGRGGD